MDDCGATRALQCNTRTVVQLACQRCPRAHLGKPHCLACNFLVEARGRSRRCVRRAGGSRGRKYDVAVTSEEGRAMVRSKLLFAVAMVLGSSAMMLGTISAARAADPPKCE